MNDSVVIARQRRWPLILTAMIVVLAASWAGFWYYGVGAAERAIAGWKAREAQSGRVHECVRQTISGFPFGIQAHCADASIALTSTRPPLAVRLKELLISASLWQPTVLTTEFVGPLTVAEPGGADFASARWRRAWTQLHGLPTSPEGFSIKFEQPVVGRVPSGDNLFKADRLEIDGRLLSGSVRDRPVVEVALKLAAASSASWHQAASIPADANITAVLRGLKDFAPKPWPERFRELQAAGGRIEISHARVQQRESIAVASGSLGLTAAGRLDGQLNLTVANLEKFLPALGIDRLLAPEAQPSRLNSAFSALDRIVPGLGNVARNNVGPAIVAGVNLMGKPAELEGQRAVTLPLRFNDGAVSLGPLPIGMVPPLF